MTTSDTKERILDAAEQIFDEQGLEAFSLRAVTARAGVNLAAVNYHFGSKAALLAAISQRFFTSVNDEQLRRLEELQTTTDTPTVRELLMAYTLPIFALFDMPRGRERVQAWMMSRSGMPGTLNYQLGGEGGNEITRRYYEALRHALPHLSPEELWWRFERTHNLLMANQGRRVMTLPRTTPPDERAWLITYLTGALCAPATAL